MNERRADFAALHAFARQGDQQAFAALARRHVDLVYAIALRKVSDPGAAQEVGQTVFATLARKAWSFGPDDSLPAWLHRTTLLEAKQWWRGELRRRRREETAAQLGTTMKTPDDQPALQALVPLLDEALLSLREKDRTALLLRYYESRSLREVGESLGVREDAAQKRVAGALEQLSRFFQRQGYKTATVAAAAAALQEMASAAPAVVAASFFQTALQAAPPTLGAGAMFLARLASLSRVQTAAACLAVAAVPVAWQWNTLQDTQQQIAFVQNQITLAQTQQQELNLRIQNLEPEAIQLQGALADADQAEAERAQNQRRWLALKERIRGLLNDPNYRWPTDLPFVRIPKSAVPAFSFTSPVVPPGLVTPEVRELLGMTPEERKSIENVTAGYYSTLDEHIDASAYETNERSLPFLVPADVTASTTFIIPPLGDEVAQAAGQMFDNVASVLGPDRSPIFTRGTNLFGTDTLGQTMGLNFGRQSQTIALWVRDADAKHSVPTAGYGWYSQNMGFSTEFDFSLQPGTEYLGSRNDPTVHQSFSDAITSRLLQWYTKQADNLRSTKNHP